MKANLNIWKSPDDGLFRFHVENEAGHAIRKKGVDVEVVIRQGCEHLQRSLIAEFESNPITATPPQE